MGRLSMTQFKKYCTEHTDAFFVYDSRNSNSTTKTSKNSDSTANTYGISHIGYYDDVIIMLNPNRICFRNQRDTITFNGVEQITIDSDYLRGVSDIIGILCKGDSTKHIILVGSNK